MNLIILAVVLALIAFAIDRWFGPITEPWRKIVLAGIIVLFVVGLIFVVLGITGTSFRI